MATTREDIRRWLERSKQEPGATNMVVLCDTFDYSDYPVYVYSAEEARYLVDTPGTLTKAMECYNLSLDWEAQLAEPRAWHL